MDHLVNFHHMDHQLVVNFHRWEQRRLRRWYSQDIQVSQVIQVRMASQVSQVIKVIQVKMVRTVRMVRMVGAERMSNK